MKMNGNGKSRRWRLLVLSLDWSAGQLTVVNNGGWARVGYFECDPNVRPWKSNKGKNFLWFLWFDSLDGDPNTQGDFQFNATLFKHLFPFQTAGCSWNVKEQRISTSERNLFNLAENMASRGFKTACQDDNSSVKDNYGHLQKGIETLFWVL